MRSDITIRELRVEEGFLDGLVLPFTPGLNVLIGPRGSGKTSVIELIRFCLGAPALTVKMATQSRQQALSILGSGRVTVVLEIDGEEHAISRSADEETRARSMAGSVLVLGQNEIEEIGRDPSGRLALIDSFITDDGEDEKKSLLEAQIQSITVEIRDLLDEISELQRQLDERSKAEQELTAAELEQRRSLKAAAASAALESRLNELQRALAAGSAREAVYERTFVALERWRDGLMRAMAGAPRIEEWPTAAASIDHLVTVRASVSGVMGQLSAAAESVSSAIDEIKLVQQTEAQEKSQLSQQSRELRQQLDEVLQGAGAVARRVMELRQLASQASALRGLVTERSARLADAGERRRGAHHAWESIRASRHAARVTVARRLAGSLGSLISVTVADSEALAGYASAVAGALRGSGLHYSALAQTLADSMSPRELVELVEAGDAQGVAVAASIPLERAARVVDSIRRAGYETIMTAPVDDAVSLALNVDGSYRLTDQLSTGQRCTVILPIVLCQHGRPVLVDQPEDNLDNEYIAGSVVPALTARGKGDQLILATHNPNIPVLGNADQVVVLEADGRHGKVRHRGALLDPGSVDAITAIMEGGADAFRRRAQIYGL